MGYVFFQISSKKWIMLISKTIANSKVISNVKDAKGLHQTVNYNYNYNSQEKIWSFELEKTKSQIT